MEDKEKFYSICLALIAFFLLLFTLIPSVTASSVTCNVEYDNYNYWSDESYPVIDLFGEKYVLFFTEDGSVVRVNQLAKLLRDDATKYTFKTDEFLNMGEGYSFVVKQIDIEGEKVWLELQQDGYYIDDEIISSDSTWICTQSYTQDLSGFEDDIVVFKVHVNQFFMGAEESIVQIDGLWLIDYKNAETLEVGDKIGDLKLIQIINRDESNAGSLVFESGETIEVSVYSESRSVKLNEPSEITVTVTDTYGERISGVDIELTTDIGELNPAYGTTDQSGEFVSTFTSSFEGTATITAQVVDEISDASGETKIKVDLPTPSILVISKPESVELNKPSEITVTVTGTDGKGISGANVEMETGLGKVNPVSGMTDSSGKFVSTFTSSTEGTATITAEVTKEGIKDVSSETRVKVEPAGAPDVLVTSKPESVELNKPSEITITVIGTDGKGISGASVKLTSDIGELKPASGTTDTSGKFVSTFTSSDEGTATITAQVTKEGISDASSETKIKVGPAGAPDVIVISAPKSIKTDNSSTVTVTVTGTDGKGISGANVEMETSLGKIDPASGTTNSDGKFVSTFTSSDEGTATIKADVTKEGIGDASGETKIKVEPVGSPNVLVTSKPDSVVLNNSSTITVTVRGADDKRISGASVVLTSDIGKVDPASGTTDLSGKFISTFTPSTEGTATIEAIIKDGDRSATGETTVNVLQPLEPIIKGDESILVSSKPASVKADKPSTITVAVKEKGKGISGANVELKTNLGKVDPASGTTNSFGEFTSTFTSSDEGTATIEAHATKEGLDLSGDTSIEVKSGINPYIVFLAALFSFAGIVALSRVIPRSPGRGKKQVLHNNLIGGRKLGMQIEPESIMADGKATSIVTIELQDEKGHAISFSNGGIVELSTDLGTITSPIKVLPGEMKVTATITAGEEPGTAKISVSFSPVNGEGETLHIEGKIVFTGVKPNEEELDIRIEPDSISADGKSTTTATIRIKDENGKFIPSPNGKIIELFTDLGTITSPVKMLPGEKAVTVTITSAQKPGTAKITASTNSSKEDKLLHGTGKVVFTEIALKEKELDIQVEPKSILADGESTAAVTIKIKDEKGDFIPSPDGKIVELSTDLGTITSPIKILPGETTVTATITSGKVAGNVKIIASSNPVKGEGEKLGGIGKIVFTEVVPEEKEIDMQIAPDSIPADGKSTATVTIRIKDEKGNFIPSCNGKIVELFTNLGNITSPIKILPGETTVTATITSGKVEGNAKIIASLSPINGDGKSLRVERNMIFKEIEFKEAGLDVQIEPDSIPANGKSTAKIKIKIKDENGNFIPSRDEKIIDLSTTLGRVTNRVTITSGSQEVTATITSGRVVGTAKVTANTFSEKGKTLHGEGKVVFTSPVPEESDFEVENIH